MGSVSVSFHHNESLIIAEPLFPLFLSGIILFGKGRVSRRVRRARSLFAPWRLCENIYIQIEAKGRRELR